MSTIYTCMKCEYFEDEHRILSKQHGCFTASLEISCDISLNGKDSEATILSEYICFIGNDRFKIWTKNVVMCL